MRSWGPPLFGARSSFDLHPERQRFDGVSALWYGKGPGVDRCSDVFKHANMAGTAKHGGVIAVAGDDHAQELFSSAPERSHFQSPWFPVFFPSSVQEILIWAWYAYAMSRFFWLVGGHEDDSGGGGVGFNRVG